MNQQTYPQKMYSSKMFKNIPMFKRADLSPYCDGEWKGMFEDEFDVEVINDKARVYSNNPFNHKPSRFCKLKLIREEKDSNMRVFQLIVNGQKAFFKIAHIIRK